MEKYKIAFENSLSGKKGVETTVSSTKEVIEHYKSINWFELLKKATPENQNDSDIMDDNSWNFSIEYEKYKKEYILHIYPHLYPTPSVKPDDIKLVVEFKESNIVPTSKFVQFFGSSKVKKVEQYKTEATDLLQEDILEYLKDFLNTNHMNLKKLNSNEFDTMFERICKAY